MGVILGHHADDQAETILFRLLRGSGPAGLAGMKAKGTVAGITVLRPLLDVRRTELREYLKQRGQICARMRAISRIGMRQSRPAIPAIASGFA